MVEQEITYMNQLLHHRAVRNQIARSDSTWSKRSSWFPSAQAKEYSQISAVYKDCLKKYGAEKFRYFATRHRLNKKYTEDDFAVPREEERRTEISMGYLAGYKVPRTTNGIYGSVRPSHQFFCMVEEN